MGFLADAISVAPGWRIERLRGTRPHAARLACLASLAVRIDTPLLRALRLELMPEADAGAEADLWFSDLVESAGVGGFVLDAPVQAVLREQLVAMVEHRPAAAGVTVAAATAARPLDVAWTITEQCHATLPHSLRIEERVTWLALARGEAAVGEIDTLLRPALSAMAVDPERGDEIAGWALRAVPRLPPMARGTGAARALLLGAAARLGAEPRMMGDVLSTGGLPPYLKHLLPPDVLARRSQFTCEASDAALVLRPFGAETAGDGGPSAVLVSLPITEPRVVELRVRVGDAKSQLIARTLVFDHTGRAELPLAWSAIEIRSLAGDRWRLSKVREFGAWDTRRWHRSVVWVEGQDGGAVGVAVGASEVLTIKAALGKSSLGASLRLLLDGQTRLVEAGVGDLDSELLLLQLDEREPDFALRPAEIAAFARIDSPLGVLHGTGEKLQALPARLISVGGRVLELYPDGRPHQFLSGFETRGWMVGLRSNGAPMVQDDAVVGLVSAVRGPSDRQRGLYIEGSRIDAFLRWARRPPAEWPAVFVSEEDTGIPLPTGVDTLLAAARLRPLSVDGPTKEEQGRKEVASGSARKYSQWNAVATAVARADAGLAIVDRGTRRDDLLWMAWRKWAEPDWPMMTLDSGNPRIASVRFPPAIADSTWRDEREGQSIDAVLRERLDPTWATHPSRPAPINALREALLNAVEEAAGDRALAADTLALAERKGLAAAEPAALRWIERASPAHAATWLPMLFALAVPNERVFVAMRAAFEARSHAFTSVLCAGVPTEVLLAQLQRLWYPRQPPGLLELGGPWGDSFGEAEGSALGGFVSTLCAGIGERIGADAETIQRLLPSPVELGFVVLVDALSPGEWIAGEEAKALHSMFRGAVFIERVAPGVPVRTEATRLRLAYIEPDRTLDSYMLARRRLMDAADISLAPTPGPADTRRGTLKRSRATARPSEVPPVMKAGVGARKRAATRKARR